MKKVWIASALCALLLLGLLLFGYSGVYNVAATAPHTAPVFWMLSTMTERSIEAHAPDVAPPDLEGENTLRVGLGHYNAMCITCRGAPGMPPAEWASGLYPPPPNLAAGSTGLKPLELFWVIKNGIKMTGMPAFGPTHSDDRIWAMVSAVEKLPQWSPNEYEKEVMSLGLAVAGHSHGELGHDETLEATEGEEPSHEHESENHESGPNEELSHYGDAHETHSR